MKTLKQIKERTRQLANWQKYNYEKQFQTGTNYEEWKTVSREIVDLIGLRQSRRYIA